MSSVGKAYNAGASKESLVWQTVAGVPNAIIDNTALIYAGVGLGDARMVNEGLQGFAVLGATWQAPKAIGVAGRGVSATAEWLAPKFGEMTEGYLYKTGGLAYAMPPEAKARLVDQNRIDGTARQALVDSELAVQYPLASIQSESYLRLGTGRRAIDPLTGTARRIDSVVIQDSRVLDSVETTSMTASKDAQILKEMRIREAGGTFVRDRSTGQLLDISEVPTRIVRKP